MELCALGLLKCKVCQEVFKVYSEQGDVEFCPICGSWKIGYIEDDQD